MTIQQVVKLCNVPRSTLYYWMKQGWINPEKKDVKDRMGRPQKINDINLKELDECCKRGWPKYRRPEMMSKK